MKAPVLLIAAHNRAGYIGRGNALMYKLPEDMRNFKAMTTGQVVIMGRKTFESMGNKCLPDRLNIIVTKSIFGTKLGAKGEPLGICVPTMEAALQSAQDYIDQKGLQNTASKIFVIGGAEIYKAALPFAEKAYITFIEDDEVGDVKFPVEEFIKAGFVETEFTNFIGLDNGYEIEINTWEKRQPVTENPGLLWSVGCVRQDINKGTMIGVGDKFVRISSIESLNIKHGSPVVTVATATREYPFRFDNEVMRDLACQQLREIVGEVEK